MTTGFKKLRPVALTFAAALLLAGCDSAEDRLADHLASGQELISEGALEKAALEFRNALSIDANSVDAHMGMSAIYERQKNYAAMIAHLNKVTAIDPANGPALIRLGQLMLLANKLDEANENATAAIEAAPENADALALKAGVSLRLGNVETAVELAEKALAIQPEQPNASSVLIGAKLRADDVDAAFAIAEDATARMPSDLGLALVKLRILEGKGDDEATGAYLGETIGRFPEQYALREAMAQWRHDRGETDLAEQQLRAIADAQPDESGPKLRVAQYIMGTKGREAARAELGALATAAEDASPYIVALSEIDFDEGKADEGKARLLEAISASDDAGDKAAADRVRLILAQRLLSENDQDGALELAQTVLAEDAANADALAVRAAIAYERGEYNEAILDLRTALASSPSDPRLLLLSARTNERTGNTDLAGERLAAAMQASEFNPAITLEYVRFLKANGRRDSTATILAEAVRRNPQNRDLLTELASAQLRAQDWVGADQTAAQLKEIDSGVSKRVEAASLSGQERYDESLNVLGSLAEEEGDTGSALAAIVQVHLKAGDREAARSFLKDVLADNPDNAQALLLTAGIDIADKKFDAAEAGIKAAVAADPEMVVTHLSLARFYGSRGETEKAIAAARKGVEASADPTALHLLLGGYYETQQKNEEAIAEYRALYELRPTSTVAANNLASMLVETRGEDPAVLAEAEEIARPLRSLDVPAFQDTYGWIEHLRGNNEQALRWLAPAVEGLPNNPYVQYHAGAVYAALGDAEKARPLLEAAAGADGFARSADAKALLKDLPTD